MIEPIDREDVEVIAKGAILIALISSVVLVAALTAGAAVQVFRLAGGL